MGLASRDECVPLCRARGLVAYRGCGCDIACRARAAAGIEQLMAAEKAAAAAAAPATEAAPAAAAMAAPAH